MCSNKVTQQILAGFIMIVLATTKAKYPKVRNEDQLVLGEPFKFPICIQGVKAQEFNLQR